MNAKITFDYEISQWTLSYIYFFKDRLMSAEMCAPTARNLVVVALRVPIYVNFALHSA